MTKNYTGAEIEAVCRSAKQFALFEEESIKTLDKNAGKK
jgi:vesicle-fusing ATPase